MAKLRSEFGLKIGSSTGYTSEIMAKLRWLYFFLMIWWQYDDDNDDDDGADDDDDDDDDYDRNNVYDDGDGWPLLYLWEALYSSFNIMVIMMMMMIMITMVMMFMMMVIYIKSILIRGIKLKSSNWWWQWW